MMSGMAETLRFVEAVRAIAAESRRLGLDVPGFRSPPRLEGVTRSLRRRPGASPSVAVRRAGRPFDEVVVDMVEGVVVANGLAGRRADEIRARLLAVAAPAEAA